VADYGEAVLRAGLRVLKEKKAELLLGLPQQAAE
jgi:hypothetical protein